MIRFFPFTKFHNKDSAGSTRIRVENLIKYWPEADLYKYGEDPDVLIFQKVYVTQDYTFPLHFPKIKILDICDPDWLDGTAVKQTVDTMDAVVCPTESIAEFMRQLTDKPIRIIKDRFDLAEIPPPKVHTKEPIKQVVWFGYAHNADCLRTAVPLLARMKIKLMVISESDPQAWRWASTSEQESMIYRPLCTYKKYEQETIYQLLQRSDACILPKSHSPRFRFKSENKTIVANLAGLPVAYDDADLSKLNDASHRAKISHEAYNRAMKEYDCKISVTEYQELIEELKS